MSVQEGPQTIRGYGSFIFEIAQKECVGCGKPNSTLAIICKHCHGRTRVSQSEPERLTAAERGKKWRAAQRKH